MRYTVADYDANLHEQLLSEKDGSTSNRFRVVYQRGIHARHHTQTLTHTHVHTHTHTPVHTYTQTHTYTITHIQTMAIGNNETLEKFVLRHSINKHIDSLVQKPSLTKK